ncbi:MAG: hypothetical protein FWE54_04225 [Methanimicrococcus sp.]|nr:hypothetical protein [Methanimicrococcus sp.]
MILFILGPLYVLTSLSAISEMIKGEITHWQTIIKSIPVILCLSGFIFHFLLYSVLKKKYNFKKDVFLYGVGFTSAFIAFVFFTLIVLHNGTWWGASIEEAIWYFYILPFTSLYYSYATLLKNKEKRASRVTLILLAITVISFALLIIFEISEYRIPYIAVLPVLYVLYLSYCLIHKKGTLGLREFAWIPFLPLMTMLAYSLFIGVILRGII